jgi:hypothetical protein
VLLLAVMGRNLLADRAAGSSSGSAPGPAALADPQALLKDTMTRYTAMETFQADYAWRLGANGEKSEKSDNGAVSHDHDGDGVSDHASEPGQEHAPGDGHDHAGSAGAEEAGTSAKRTLLYARPNRFRVTSETGGFRLTTVSDGKRLSEYASSPTLPGRTYPAPPSLASESTLLLQHPLFCATLLHRFFAGPNAFEGLVDLSHSPARFGPDVRVGDVPCKTVLFTARGMYGNTEVAIGTQDGLIRRIRCDGAPLREEMQKSAKGQEVPSMATEETYNRLVVGEPIPPETFVTDLPAGVKSAPSQSGPAAAKPR